MRRTLALALATALLASGCGGGGTKRPVAADAPRATTPPPSPRPLVLWLDGEKQQTMTIGRTVREVLTLAKVELGQWYLVKPELEEPAGDTVKVRRLLSKPVTKTVKVDPPVVRRKSKKLEPWAQQTVRKGKPGLMVVTTAHIRKGRKKVKAVVDKTTKRKPVSTIIAVGPQPSSVGGTAGGLNWAGLARCESGGNPRAVNPAGYYGLYQFSLQTWSTVGGTGLPSNASAAEQTYRAQLLYNKVNGRWQGQWPNCGRFLLG